MLKKNPTTTDIGYVQNNLQEVEQEIDAEKIIRVLGRTFFSESEVYLYRKILSVLQNNHLLEKKRKNSYGKNW